jgi:hypothetical protein
MYCDSCGSAIANDQKFCSKCGKPIALAAPTPATNRIAAHLKMLAIFWVIISVVTRLLPGLFLVLGADVAAGFIPPDAPGFILPLLRGIGILLIGLAALGLFTAWGLAERQPWARITMIIFAFLSLLEIPFGTALGIYTLWVLLPEQSAAEFRQLSFSGPAL